MSRKSRAFASGRFRANRGATTAALTRRGTRQTQTGREETEDREEMESITVTWSFAFASASRLLTEAPPPALHHQQRRRRLERRPTL